MSSAAAPSRSVFAKLGEPSFRRGLVVPILLIVVWYFATKLNLVNRHIVVGPEKVWASALQQLEEGAIVEPLLASLRRDGLGFLIGSSAGLVVGALMGMSRLFDRLVGPTFHAAKQVAIFAWIPLMSVWFGTGELGKVVFIALSAFYPVVLNTHEGVAGVSREYVEVARVFRFSRWQVVRKVVLPAALPSIFAGIHLALIYAWLGTLGAEYLLAAAPGIGNLMIEGRESFAMDKVLLGIIIAGGVGATLNALASSFEKHALRWRVRGL
jgi:sulfonate transport system permease protein